MSDTGSDIIVKGSSVTLSYDSGLYPKVSEDPSTLKNDNRKITRVLVEDEDGNPRYDSGAVNDDGLKWTITVSTK